MEVLFVGINPSIYSARAGHYYARAGNLFWRCLHEAGLTPVRLRPDEDRRVSGWGLLHTGFAHARPRHRPPGASPEGPEGGETPGGHIPTHTDPGRVLLSL